VTESHPHRRYANNTFGVFDGRLPAPSARSASALGRETMSQRLADRLITAIAVGAYSPGDRLPPERDLAEHLGVSRVTIRQALKIVADRGLLIARRGQGGGTFVAEPSPAKVWDAAKQTLDQELPKLKELCDFRCLIEGTIARTAAHRRTAADVESLCRSLNDFQTAKNLSSARAADRRLHTQIAVTCRNSRLAELSSALSIEATLGFGSEPYPEYMLKRATDEHVHLVDRISAGDPEGAFQAAYDHYQLTYAIMQDYLTALQERGGD
jgi:GntR family transcriptional regulator, transcriptional repressor for pyruvate dehydrogenase complex